MTTGGDPGTVRRLRAELAHALLEQDRLDEAIDQFMEAMGEPGDTPSAREIERQVQRIDKLRGEAEFGRLLDAAVTSPGSAVASLTDARRLMADQPSLTRNSRLRGGAEWIDHAVAELGGTPAELALDLLLGDSCLRGNHFADAHEWYQRAVAVEPVAEALLGAAEAAHLSGQTAAAARWLEQVPGTSRRERVLRAGVLHASGDHEKAAQLVDELVSAGEADAAVRLLRGSISLALGDADGALEAATSVLDGDASHVGALGLLTQAHCARYEWPAATASAVKVFRIDPTGFETLLVRAQALLERGADPRAWADPSTDGTPTIGDTTAGRMTARASINEAVTLINELSASRQPGGIPLVLGRALAGRPGDADLNFLAASFIVGQLEVEVKAEAEADVEADARAIDDREAQLERARALLDLAGASQAGAWVHDLTARLLDLDGDVEGAFAARLAAAEQLQADDDHAGALRILEGLTPPSPADGASVGFLIAYSALALAWATTPADQEIVGRGLAAWRSAFAVGDPGSGREWTYATYAHLVTIAAERSPLAGDEQRREALAHFEVGALVTPERSDSWSRLAQGHRMVGTWHLALEAAEHALDLQGPDAESDWYARDQLIAAHAWLDHRDEARRLVDEYLVDATGDPNVHLGLVKSVAAFVYAADGDDERAEGLLSELLDDDPLDRWSLLVRADVRRRRGNLAGAQADLAAVPSLPDFDPDGADRVDAAVVAFWSGDPERACRLIEAAAAAGSRERSSMQSLAELGGAALVACGRLEEGERQLTRSVELADQPRTLQERLPLLLSELVRRSDDPAVAALTGRIEQAIRDRVEVLTSEPKSAASELDDLRATEGSPSFEAWGLAAADLATIRRALAANDLELVEAALDEASERARPDEQRRVVDIGLHAARHDLAYRSLQSATASARSVDAATTLAALARWLPLLDEDEALEVWRDETATLADVATIDGLVRAMDGGGERAQRLHLQLLAVIGERLGADRTMGPRITPPLALTLGRDVIPEDTSNEGWVLFNTYLVELRQRIDWELRVPLPGINVREHASADRFSVLVDEIERDSGELAVGWGFVAAPVEDLAHLPGDAVRPAVDPMTGASAALVRHDVWDLVPDGVEALADPVALAVRHLEAVIRRDIGHFVYPEVARNVIVLDEELSVHHDDGPMIRRLTRVGAAAVDEGRSLRRLDQAGLLLAANPDATDDELLAQMEHDGAAGTDP